MPLIVVEVDDEVELIAEKIVLKSNVIELSEAAAEGELVELEETATRLVAEMAELERVFELKGEVEVDKVVVELNDGVALEEKLVELNERVALDNKAALDEVAVEAATELDESVVGGDKRTVELDNGIIIVEGVDELEGGILELDEGVIMVEGVVLLDEIVELEERLVELEGLGLVELEEDVDEVIREAVEVEAVELDTLEVVKLEGVAELETLSVVEVLGLTVIYVHASQINRLQ